MTIDLRTLDQPNGTLALEKDVSFEDPFGEDGETTVPCRIVVDYNHSGGVWLFHVRVSALLETECHRCLDPVRQPLDGEFDAVVRRSGTGDEHAGESNSDEFITLGLNEHEVDLTDLVRENLVVSVPMLILCGESCRGLCPGCGVNRNREECGCPEAGDPRWDALRKLAGRKENKE